MQGGNVPAPPSSSGSFVKKRRRRRGSRRRKISLRGLKWAWFYIGALALVGLVTYYFIKQ